VLAIDHINLIRSAELESILPFLGPGKRILELGAGTGRQALELSRLGFDVTAIDLAASDYAAERLFPIVEYDGTTIPFEEGSFDVVLSSNVLEHIGDLPAMHREIRRVLTPQGECFHIIPTEKWRFWSTVSAFPNSVRLLVSARSIAQLSRAIRHAARSFLQKPHGERGNVVTELWYFRPAWWRRHFRDNGFELVREGPVGIYYTGEMVFGLKLSIGTRRKLARYLGSACWLYQLRQANPGP
jgi:ubiquinone/menaquinone biosynthesis C-methylase UbiE